MIKFGDPSQYTPVLAPDDPSEYDQFLKSSEGNPFSLGLLEEKAGPAKYYYDFFRDGFGPGQWVTPSLSKGAQSAQAAFTNWKKKNDDTRKQYAEYLQLSRAAPGRQATLLTVPGAEISPTLLSENQSKGRTLIG